MTGMTNTRRRDRSSGPGSRTEQPVGRPAHETFIALAITAFIGLITVAAVMLAFQRFLPRSCITLPRWVRNLLRLSGRETIRYVDGPLGPGTPPSRSASAADCPLFRSPRSSPASQPKVATTPRPTSGACCAAPAAAGITPRVGRTATSPTCPWRNGPVGTSRLTRVAHADKRQRWPDGGRRREHDVGPDAGIAALVRCPARASPTFDTFRAWRSGPRLSGVSSRPHQHFLGSCGATRPAGRRTWRRWSQTTGRTWMR